MKKTVPVERCDCVETSTFVILGVRFAARLADESKGLC